MTKLRLKRTPAEERIRKLEKHARKVLRKKVRDVDSDEGERSDPSSSCKRQRRSREHSPEYGPPPPQEGAGPSRYDSSGASHSSYETGLDYNAIRAEIEEARFREKMMDAFQDDERLDALEARLNDFAHVPDRWRSGGGRNGQDRVYNEHENELHSGIDPRYMEDEEYAEWVRVGMWRKTHVKEHEEHLRHQAAKAERRAHEKHLKAEAARLEKAAEEERRQRKRARETRKYTEFRQTYEASWKSILASDGNDAQLQFEDIPWPLFAAYTKPEKRMRLETKDFNKDAISGFIFDYDQTGGKEGEKKERKEKLRQTLLRFHPDKFEGRLMQRVRIDDKERVREAVGVVVRVLNTLMDEAS